MFLVSQGQRQLYGLIGRDWSGTGPAIPAGRHTADLAKALREIGFKVGRVWTTVAAENGDFGHCCRDYLPMSPVR